MGDRGNGSMGIYAGRFHRRWVGMLIPEAEIPHSLFDLRLVEPLLKERVQE